MRKIKRDDNVIMLAGKDRGKTGIVRQIVGGGDLIKVKGHRPKIKEDKVFVTNLNMVKRHRAQRPGVAQGGIIEKEMPVPISQGHADLQELQQADPRRIHDPGRRQAPGVPQVRPGHRLMATTTPRLKERYKSEIAAELTKQFGYKNPMQVPRVEKVTLNIGLGEARDNARAVESATADIATISGQKPIVTRAKKAIANFKIRENMPIGVAVTHPGRPHV